MSTKKQNLSSSGVGFEEIEHTADISLRVRGEDLEKLMENSALGMADILCEKSFLSDEYLKEFVDIEADDKEGLLVEWLSELVFLVETKSFIFRRFDCENLSETHLKAKVYGKIAEKLKVYIKAVTYHNLQIVETQDGFEATVVFDV
ncbi:MAG: archease [Desulfobacterales bacterium]